MLGGSTALVQLDPLPPSPSPLPLDRDLDFRLDRLGRKHNKPASPMVVCLCGYVVVDCDYVIICERYCCFKYSQYYSESGPGACKVWMRLGGGLEEYRELRSKKTGYCRRYTGGGFFYVETKTP
jgi:hypothetical protein